MSFIAAGEPPPRGALAAAAGPAVLEGGVKIGPVTISVAVAEYCGS
jgi:hypothetical protein